MKREKRSIAENKLSIQRLIRYAFTAVVACSSLAMAQHWEAAPQFPGMGAGTALLRNDGTVMVQEMTGQASQGGSPTGNWFVLIPDKFGSYTSGTWAQIASMPDNYAPLYYASAVLPGGKIYVQGGEYNGSSGKQVETNFGVLYEKTSSGFAWVPLTTSPGGLSQVGDAQSILLPNDPVTGHGRLLVGNCCSGEQNILDLSTLTWTTVGTGKTDGNSEEGWTMLPDGKVLTIDTNTKTHVEAEVFVPNPAAGKTNWTRVKNLPANNPLVYNCVETDGSHLGNEIGPAVLRPDGTVFATGANGLTAIYNYKTNTWKAGPVIPPNSAGEGQDGIADGPAALLPNGHVLMMTSNINPCIEPPADFYEFDGTFINRVPGPPNAGNEVSFDGRMVELPSGHIFFTDGSSDVEIFFPTGGPLASWAPSITSFPATVKLGTTYTISGTQFNGLSQGAAYGDDAQSATNYPLVQITFPGTGQVEYAPTANLNPGKVATGSAIVKAQFTFSGPATGAAQLRVIANGIASAPVNILVK